MILAAIRLNRPSAIAAVILSSTSGAMPVDLPPGAGVFEKALPGAWWKLAPELLGEGTQSVDHAAPVAAFCAMGVDAIAQPAQQSTGAGAKRDLRLIDPLRLDPAVCPRQQSAA